MRYQLHPSTVHAYLLRCGICGMSDQLVAVETLHSKNLNLLVTLSPAAAAGAAPKMLRLLVKQVPLGDASRWGEGFKREWAVYHWIQSCRDLAAALEACLPDPLHHDPCSGILVFRFLEQYWELGSFYKASRCFPAQLATALGATLASLHQATCGRLDRPAMGVVDQAALLCREMSLPQLGSELDALTPDIFRCVQKSALKFYILYQQSPELADAIASLEDDYQPCCLIHRDLKFANVLLHKQWLRWRRPALPASSERLSLLQGEGLIRLIDWEQWAWGDPALDVGFLVADYLRMWLKSMPLSRDLDVALALQRAALPLETLQPSIRNLIDGYIAQFPAILQVLPDFVERVLRFAGLGLLTAIQDRLHYKQPFGNREISMMQVARSLLCDSAAAVRTLVGDQAASRTSVNGPSGVIEDGISDLSPAPSVPINGSSPSPRMVSHPISPQAWLQQAASHRVLLADLCASIVLTPDQIGHPACQPLCLIDQIPEASPIRQPQACGGTIHAGVQSRRLHRIRDYLHRIYCRGEWLASRAEPSPGDDFIRQLEEANSGSGYADSGWTVISADEDEIQVVKDGLHLWADPLRDLLPPRGLTSGFDVLPSPSVLTPGSDITLRLPNAVWRGDYYVAIGNAGEPLGDSAALDLFFNINAEGSILLMRSVVPSLNRWSVPFALKLLADPSWYDRWTTVVLRLPISAYDPLHTLLCGCYGMLRRYLRDPIPLFTLPLAAGIGLAETPANGDEGGLHRLELVVQALLAAEPEPKVRLQLIRQRFEQHGLDWQQPHLNPGSTGSYLPLDASVAVVRRC